MNDPALTGYRPVSAWAIAGFGLALAFVLGVVVLGGIALWTGLPMVLPGFLGLAAAGFGVSLAGWLHVRRAEGARAGLALARWGMGLSLVFGVAYTAYVVAKDLAVRLEAQAFADAWLAKLIRSEVESAFLETRPPDQRQGDDPGDRVRLEARYGAVELPRFRQQQLVQQLSQWGSATSFECQGVRRWSYVGAGYHVELSYRIHAPDGDHDLLLAVYGVAPAGMAQRQWQVLFREPLRLNKR
jgi:hypothetical protein